MPGHGVVAGIDVGTTKIELDVYSEDGALVLRRVERNRTIARGPVAEQDPEAILGIVKSMISDAIGAGAGCVGLTVYRGSLVAWSRSGEPVTRVITWMDLRPHVLWHRLPWGLRLARRLPRLGEAFSPESMTARLAALLVERPELRRGLEEGSLLAWNLDAYLVHRLTGVYAADSSTAALTGLVDPRTLEPLGLAWRLAGLPRFELPRLLAHEGVEPLEIKEGGRLAAVIGDQQAASVGLDCLAEGCLKAALGTGFFLDLSTGPRLRLSPGGGLVPLILLDRGSTRVYGVEAYASGLGHGVEWFVDNMLGGSYGALDESVEARGRPPLLVPYVWGSRTPRLWRGTAGVLGIEPGHSKRDIAAGLAHGLAASVALLYREISRRASRPSRVRIAGGLSRLRRLVGLVAAYLERSVDLAATPGSASALGAAVLAARNCGVSFEPEVRVEEVDPIDVEYRLDPDLLEEAALEIEALISRRKGANTQAGRG